MDCPNCSERHAEQEANRVNDPIPDIVLRLIEHVRQDAWSVKMFWDHDGGLFIDIWDREQVRRLTICGDCEEDPRPHGIHVEARSQTVDVDIARRAPSVESLFAECRRFLHSGLLVGTVDSGVLTHDLGGEC